MEDEKVEVSVKLLELYYQKLHHEDNSSYNKNYLFLISISALATITFKFIKGNNLFFMTNSIVGFVLCVLWWLSNKRELLSILFWNKRINKIEEKLKDVPDLGPYLKEILANTKGGEEFIQNKRWFQIGTISAYTFIAIMYCLYFIIIFIWGIYDSGIYFYLRS